MTIFKQISSIGFTIVAALGLSGCSDNPFSSKTTIRPTTLGTYAENKESDPGSRNNPYSLGEKFSVDKWDVAILKVNKDAFLELEANEIFVNETEVNEKLVLFNLVATYNGEDSGYPSSDLTFKIVGSKGNTFSKSCGFLENDFAMNTEVFKGASVTGELCFIADSDQLDKATISVQESFNSEKRRFVLIP